MCRMLGLLSTRPVQASEYLWDADCSLYKLALLGHQGDGWGIGHYVDGELRIFKSEKPVYEEEALFRDIVSPIQSEAIVAHVRKASNPKNLPRNSLISKENSQPFHHMNRVFVHNGTLFIPDQVMNELGEYRDLVRGANDSEVLFAYLLLSLDRESAFEEALKSLEKGLRDIKEKSGYQRQYPYSSLNLIFSDGKELYAYEKYLIEPSTTSYCSPAPYFQMHYVADDERIVVASEKLSSGDWKPLGNGELLSARVRDDKVEFNVRKLS